MNLCELPYEIQNYYKDNLFIHSFEMEINSVIIYFIDGTHEMWKLYNKWEKIIG